jgi:hypothetical protein
VAVVEVGTSLTVVLSRSRSASRRPPRSGARAGRSGIGATSPFARAPAKDRSPPDPVVHFRRAKGRFAIRRSYSWSEADQPLRST